MYQRRKQLMPELARIPAGSFLSGSTHEQVVTAASQFGLAPESLLDEMPWQRVDLAAFAIGRTPVSCADYHAFVIATDQPTPSYWGGDDPPLALREHPVVGVTFNDARSYCRWLTAATDFSFRLPSELEWERAARGDEGWIFPWGETWETGLCNVAGSGPGTTSPVGSFARDTSPYGCVDMAGNVAEWTSSRYRPYPGSSTTLQQQGIVTRGGSWQSNAENARCARRIASDPATSSAERGFRVVSDDA